MARKSEDNQQFPIADALGNRRAPVARLKRVGDEIIHGQTSSNTVADVQIDYPLLLEEVRQVEQWISIKMKNRSYKPGADEVIKAFDGKASVLLGDASTPGYATSQDIKDFLEGQMSNFDFARDLMAKAWHLTRHTIDSFLKPSRRKKS